MEPRVDSASGYWGTRSTSGRTMFDRSSASMDRETGQAADLRSKRTASAHGLNMSTEGDTDGILSPGAGATAHRRRTDLVPTIVMSRSDRSGAMTPGSRHRSPGRAVSMSRIDTCASVAISLDNQGQIRSKTVKPSKSMSHLAVSSPQYRPRRHNLLHTNSTSSLNTALAGHQQQRTRVRPRPRPKTLEVTLEKSLSRENSTASAGRPGSAMSGGAANSRTISD